MIMMEAIGATWQQDRIHPTHWRLWWTRGSTQFSELVGIISKDMNSMTTYSWEFCWPFNLKNAGFAQSEQEAKDAVVAIWNKHVST